MLTFNLVLKKQTNKNILKDKSMTISLKFRIESANLLDLNYINLTNRYYNLIYEDIGFITQSLYRERHKVYPVLRKYPFIHCVFSIYMYI